MNSSADIREKISQVNDLMELDDAEVLLQRINQISQQCKRMKCSIPSREFEKYQTMLGNMAARLQPKPSAFQFNGRPAQKTLRESPILDPSDPQRSNNDRSALPLSSTVVYRNKESNTHLQDLKRSVVFVNASASLLLTNVQDSVIIARCHQFRAHHCTNLLLYLACRNPTIENCHDLIIGGLDSEVPQAVSDFSWMRSTSSPHYVLNGNCLATPSEAQLQAIKSLIDSGREAHDLVPCLESHYCQKKLTPEA